MRVYSAGELPNFSLGKVALIGDALQTTDPYTGMGATLSLEDALYVSKMLRDHGNYEEAFYHYEADRKEKVQMIHGSAREMEKIEERIKENDSLEEVLMEEFDLEQETNAFLNSEKVYWKS